MASPRRVENPPSERELGELLGIKRMTLRQALLNLEAESKIFRKDRKGWL
ncbi:GntR family transcriptional regulator [Escherichia coli]